MTRIVVKIGSSLLTNDGRGLDMAAMNDWAGQISSERQSAGTGWSSFRPAPSRRVSGGSAGSRRPDSLS